MDTKQLGLIDSIIHCWSICSNRECYNRKRSNHGQHGLLPEWRREPHHPVNST